MGLRNALLNAVSSAITSTGDIAESITYRVKSNPVYDVYTGQMANDETDYTITAIVSVASEDVKSGLKSVGNTGELTVIFSSKGLAFTPKTDDTIVRSAEIHTISKVDKDPAGASYTLTIRKLG
jgi:hypothetical protein